METCWATNLPETTYDLLQQRVVWCGAQPPVAQPGFMRMQRVIIERVIPFYL